MTVLRLVAPLLLLPGLVACGPGDDVREVEFKVPVAVRDVGKGTVEDRIVATGTLRATQSAVLTVETAGFLALPRIDGRRLAEGDRVAAGQVVAEITGEDVRLAAGIEAAESRYRTTEQDYFSQKKLFENGFTSEDQVRRAESAMSDAKLAWERSLLTSDRTRMATPIAGVILRLARDVDDLPMADGQRVEKGLALARIAPVDRLVADVDLVGADLSRVAVDQPARVRHQAWHGETFGGKVVRLAPTVDPLTRTLRTEVEIDNSSRKLRPGMFVEVTLVVERRQDVLVVPREAVTERGGARVVFVVEGQRVARREVTLGLGDDDIVEIRQGLEGDERLVVRGLETLTDGTQVRVTGG